jgi:hypothetical protein
MKNPGCSPEEAETWSRACSPSPMVQREDPSDPSMPKAAGQCRGAMLSSYTPSIRGFRNPLSGIRGGPQISISRWCRGRDLSLLRRFSRWLRRTRPSRPLRPPSDLSSVAQPPRSGGGSAAPEARRRGPGVLKTIDYWMPPSINCQPGVRLTKALRSSKSRFRNPSKSSARILMSLGGESR